MDQTAFVVPEVSCWLYNLAKVSLNDLAEVLGFKENVLDLLLGFPASLCYGFLFFFFFPIICSSS